MKLKIFKPNTRAAESKNREIDEDKLRYNRIEKEEDFNFEKEFIRIFEDIKYKIPSSINVHSSIDGLGLGFLLGIILTLLAMFIFKLKI